MKNPALDTRSNPVAGFASLVFQGGAVVCWTLALWSLTSSLNITVSFAAEAGMWSNWIALGLFGAGLWFFARLVERELVEHPVRVPKFAVARRSQTVPPDDRSAAAA
jgi:hypothetical protein